MLNIIKNYGGTLFFYFVIFFGVLAICTRINYITNCSTFENTDNVVALNQD